MRWDNEYQNLPSQNAITYRTIIRLTPTNPASLVLRIPNSSRQIKPIKDGTTYTHNQHHENNDRRNRTRTKYKYIVTQKEIKANPEATK